MGVLEALGSAGIVAAAAGVGVSIIRAVTVLKALRGADARERPEIIRAMGEHWRHRP